MAAIEAVFSGDFGALKNLTIEQLKERDDFGRTAIHAACFKGNKEFLNYMIIKLGNDALSEVNVCDNKGNNPAHYCCGLPWDKNAIYAIPIRSTEYALNVSDNITG